MNTHTETHTYTHEGTERTYTTLHIVLPVTIKNETREVEFRTVLSDNICNFQTSNIVACQIGRGEKRHATSITAWVFETAEEAKKYHYTAENIHEWNGKVIAVNTTSATVRNRQARITDWASQIAGTETATKQNYYGGF